MNDDEVRAERAREEARRQKRNSTALMNGTLLTLVAVTAPGDSRHRLARMYAFAAAQRAQPATKKSKRKAANASKRRNRGR